MGGMWGVRRRDAARHNESGWLIRPEMRFALPLPSFLFYLFSSRISLASPPVLVRASQKEYWASTALLTHPGQHGSVSGNGVCCASDDLVHRICLG